MGYFDRGILTGYFVLGYFDPAPSRRLKEMCGGSKVRYCDVEFNPWRDGFLGRDGLHLNAHGADMVARQVFMMMKTLNLVRRRLLK